MLTRPSSSTCIRQVARSSPRGPATRSIVVGVSAVCTRQLSGKDMVKSPFESFQTKVSAQAGAATAKRTARTASVRTRRMETPSVRLLPAVSGIIDDIVRFFSFWKQNFQHVAAQDAPQVKAKRIDDRS